MELIKQIVNLDIPCWLVVGAAVGSWARLFAPKRFSFFLPSIAGALLGGIIGRFILDQNWNEFSLINLALSFLGAVVIIILEALTQEKKPS